MIKKIYDYDITKIMNGSVLIWKPLENCYDQTCNWKFFYSDITDTFIIEKVVLAGSSVTIATNDKEGLKKDLNTYFVNGGYYNGTLEWENDEDF